MEDTRSGAFDGDVPNVSLSFSQEAERAVLGALVMYGEAERVAKLTERGLKPEHFYYENYGALFEAALLLAQSGAALDSILLSDRAGQLGYPIPSDEVDALAGEAPVAGHFLDYADIIVRMARWRDRMSFVYRIEEATNKRDEDAWNKVVEELGQQGKGSAQRRPGIADRGHLQLLNSETGEYFDLPEKCPDCQAHEDEIAGLNRDIRAWRLRYMELDREKNRSARGDSFWPVAIQLFKTWKKECNHPRSLWTFDRWFECEPILKNYGAAYFERAIFGIAYDAYQVTRKNGTVKKFNEWDRLCKSADAFEEWACKAPKDWKPSAYVSSLSDELRLSRNERKRKPEKEEQKDDNVVPLWPEKKDAK